MVTMIPITPQPYLTSVVSRWNAWKTLTSRALKSEHFKDDTLSRGRAHTCDILYPSHLESLNPPGIFVSSGCRTTQRFAWGIKDCNAGSGVAVMSSLTLHRRCEGAHSTWFKTNWCMGGDPTSSPQRNGYTETELWRGNRITNKMNSLYKHPTLRGWNKAGNATK